MATPSEQNFPTTGDALFDGMTHGYKWGLDSTRTVDFSVSNGFFDEFWYNPTQVGFQLSAALDVYGYYANIKFNYLGVFSDPLTAAKNGSEINLSLDGNLFFPSKPTWATDFFLSSSFNTQFYPGVPRDIYLNVRSEANYLPSYETGL